MAWCRVSSLTAAVARTLKEERYPITRARALKAAAGKVVEGWEIDYFLGKALTKKNYSDIRALMSDVEVWLDSQA